MDFSSELIDEIVENVMRELGSGLTVETRAPILPVPANNDSGSPVVIASSVITEDVLAAHRTSGGTVVIPKGAVMTPSGRDYIRRHGITLSSAAADVSQSHRAGFSGLVVLAAPSAIVLSAAAAAGWDTSSAECPAGLAQQAVQSADAGRHALTCCRQPALTACLVNRNPQRRAAVVTPQTQITDLLQQMNPDVVCVSPDGWSFGGTLRILKQLAANSLAIPKHWQELPS